MARPAFSMLITVFNEEDNVLPVIEEIGEALPNLPPYEIVIVDDASTDRTAEILAEAKTRYPNLVVVAHRQRLGKSGALRTGAKVAKADWLLMMDGDGQNDPRDATGLFELASDDVALVAGLRRRRQDSLAKRMASRFANWLRQRLLKDECPDTGCGLKLMRRSFFVALPYYNSNHRYIPALVRLYGGRTVFLEVTDRPRLHGESKYTNLSRALVGLIDLFGVLWLMWRTPTPPPPEWTAAETIGADSSGTPWIKTVSEDRKAWPDLASGGARSLQ